MSEAPRPRDARSPEAQRRRRRVRIPDAPPNGDVGTAASAETVAVHDEPSAWPIADGDTVAVERGLRGIVGGGSSQLTPSVALRARDAARPRPEDVARAEAELTVVRRNWTPRD